ATRRETRRSGGLLQFTLCEVTALGGRKVDAGGGPAKHASAGHIRCIRE
ncbi:hypothetical protein HaLaN_29113, partial [Haematococcus lacustris]